MRLVLVFCLLTTAYADKNLYSRWIEQLQTPDAPRARQALIRAGTPALRELRRTLARTRDKEFSDKLAAIIKEIEANEPKGLRFSAGMPKMKLTVALVNSQQFKYAVRVQNRSERPIVLWPYLKLRVLDGTTGQALKPKIRRGRWGRRAGHAGALLRRVPYVTLKPYERWDFKDGIALYKHDADVIEGFQVPGPGKYILEFTYSFDRETAKKRVNQEWPPLHDKTKPWNKALELKHTFRTEMTVR